MPESVSLMTDLPKGVTRALGTLFQSHPWVEQAILFGSRARGDADARSDIDLAILAPRATQRQWLDLVFSIDELDTLLHIDVVRLEEAPKELKEAIFSEGMVLFEQSQSQSKS